MRLNPAAKGPLHTEGRFSLHWAFLLLLLCLAVQPYLVHESSGSIIIMNRESMQFASNPLNLGDHNIRILGDEFVTPPLGYDERIWSAMPNSSAPLWENQEYLVFEGKPNTHTSIASELELNPDVCLIGPDGPTVTSANGLIAEFDFMFTGGDTYFGMGWIDLKGVNLSSWDGDFREMPEGVFIDYWDRRIHCVTRCDNHTSSIVLPEMELYKSHNFRLIWRSSAVLLIIDDQIRCCLSENIPTEFMKLVISTAGFDEKTGIDDLTIDHAALYTYGYPDYSEGPLPVLVWPMNGSHIMNTDQVLFEIYGGSFDLHYSWDYGGWYEISEPWEIEVPDIIGKHVLEIEVGNFTGGVATQVYHFYVENKVTTIGTYLMTQSPKMDGYIESYEAGAGTETRILFERDDNTLMPAQLVSGMVNNSLYLGLETTIPDGIFTSAIVFVDSNGNERWGDLHDFLVRIGSPSAISAEEGIHFADPIGLPLEDALRYESGSKNDMLNFELLLDLNETDMASMESWAFRFEIEQGGSSCIFPGPGHNNDSVNLVKITYLGEKATLFSELGFFIALFVSLVSIVGVFAYKRFQTGLPLVGNALKDDKLERVRTLIASYPQRNLGRLRKISGLTDDDFDNALSELVEQNIIDIEITPDNEITRASSHSL